MNKKFLIMHYYLVIGVQRPPHTSNEDGESYEPFKVHVPSEKDLTFKQLEEVFEKEVENSWSFRYDELTEEEKKDFILDEGYKHTDYVLTSVDPFPECEAYGTDLANDYLGS
tara:strand:- start:386 stop:721 length:336 start_codon:yes stop_codon:yes gene_type:complete